MESRALATLGVRAGVATRDSESCSGALSCPLTVQATREPSSRRGVWPGLSALPWVPSRTKARREAQNPYLCRLAGCFLIRKKRSARRPEVS